MAKKKALTNIGLGVFSQKIRAMFCGYVTCSTAAGTVAKAVTLSGFSPIIGASVKVKFSNTNTAANPTLNVSGTGAKAIYYKGAVIPAGHIMANGVYEFVYNGTQYELIGVDVTTQVILNASEKTTLMDADTLPLMDSSSSNALKKIKWVNIKAELALQGLTGPTGNPPFMVTSNIATVPVGARVGDYIINTGTAAIAIGNLTGQAIGAVVKITALSPFTVETSGNIRGATGAKGDKGDSIMPYGQCSTAAGTAEKAVAVTGFALSVGARVAIKFTNTNTSNAPKLNVSSSGAKDIYYKGVKITDAEPVLEANTIYDFIYTGTYYEIVGNIASGYGF